MSHLVIMAAGTGGHIIPGIAVAREMQARGWTVSWMGTPAGMENTLVPAAGISIDRLGFAGLRGKGVVHAVKGVFKLIGSFAESLSIDSLYPSAHSASFCRAYPACSMPMPFRFAPGACHATSPSATHRHRCAPRPGPRLRSAGPRQPHR